MTDIEIVKQSRQDIIFTLNNPSSEDEFDTNDYDSFEMDIMNQTTRNVVLSLSTADLNGSRLQAVDNVVTAILLTETTNLIPAATYLIELAGVKDGEVTRFSRKIVKFIDYVTETLNA